MWMRIDPVRFNFSLAETVLQLFNEVMLPLIRRQPGFLGYQGGLDRRQFTGVGITYWETREQAEAVVDALRAIRPQLKAATVEFGPGAVYEILAEG